jgi:hypothetical protein
MTFASPSTTAAARLTAQAALQIHSGQAKSPQPAASKSAATTSAAPTDGPARRSSADSTQQRQALALVAASAAPPLAAAALPTAPPPSAASTPSWGLAVAAGSLRQSAAAALAAFTVAGQLVPASAATVAQPSLDLPAVVREASVDSVLMAYAVGGAAVIAICVVAGLCARCDYLRARDHRMAQQEAQAVNANPVQWWLATSGNAQADS